MSVLMEPGTFAGDDRGQIVIAPGDARGTTLISGKDSGSCCGLDGSDGPNMECAACGLPVASRIDDCSLWQAVWFEPGAVRRSAVGPAQQPASWAELMAEGKRTPPLEPHTGWAPRAGARYWWTWSPRWEAAAGRALARLVVAAEGRAVSVPDGLVAEVFRRSLDRLLPAGAPARRAVLAGPGVPVVDADILLVPEHPQTGESWSPGAEVSLVPLPFGIWLWLVDPEPHLYAPVSGGMPDGVLRDEPGLPSPNQLFQPDLRAFEEALGK